MKHFANSRRLPFWPVILLVVLAVVAYVIFRDKPEKVTEPPAVLTVSLTRAVQVDWPVMVDASGGIEPWQEAVIGARVGGLRLDEVRVDVGDKVKKGDLLARFDDATVRAAIAQQRAAVAQARASLTEAQSNAKRAETLRDTGALSEQDILNFTTGALTAQATLEAAQAQLNAQELQLAFTRVTAPDDGVISSRSATLGSVAAQGVELFRMVRQNRLEWRAELTGTQLVQVKPGDKAVFTLPDGSQGMGKVRQLAPVLNDQTRTAIAYVDLDKDTPQARAGMYVSGQITLASRSALAVPQASVIRRDGFEYIFTLTPERTVQQVKIVSGRRQGDKLEVLSGLDVGQELVGKGAGFLNDGDKVRVVEEGQP